MFNKQCFREVPCWKMNSRWVTVSLSSYERMSSGNFTCYPHELFFSQLSCILLFATSYCSTPGFPVPTWTQYSNLYLRPSPFLSPPDCYIQLPTCHLFIVQSLSHVLLFATPWNAAGFPFLHHLLDFARTHVHWVGNAIQPFCPLPSRSPPAFSLSQHQSLFQWVSSLLQVVKVLKLQLQHQSFQWIFRTNFL